jgi:hypothetical protein
MRFCGLGLAAVILLATAAHAGTDMAAKRARSEAVLAMSPGVQKNWESLGDGALRHKRSGLVCAAEAAMPDTPLVTLTELQGPGPDSNVVCSYRSADGSKRVDLFATLAQPGATAESEFKLQRENLLAQNKGAASLMPVRVMLVPGAVAEAFTVPDGDGKPVLSYLYTVAVKDWIVWTRVRMPGETTDKSTVEVMGMFAEAVFAIGYAGVSRTARGIPEPRVTP